MTAYIAIGIAAVLGALAIMAWAYATAPEGYEDSDGFHLGPDKRDLDDIMDGGA